MIAILLCTYNGEKYLCEQLDSLLNQSYKDYNIYIHDDGSIDNTNNILKSYQFKHSEKIHILEDNIKGRGAKNSFMWLLSKVNAEYYMFCDQDDIWLKNKVEDSFIRIKDLEYQHPQKPITVYTDLSLIDKNGNIIFPSFWKYSNFKIKFSNKFNFLSLKNVVTGCTMIFNNRAKQISFPINENIQMHDYSIALMTAKYGILDYIPKQTILYRQHENNVVGCGIQNDYNNIIPKSSFIDFIKQYKQNKKFYDSIDYGPFIKVLWYKIILFIISRI